MHIYFNYFLGLYHVYLKRYIMLVYNVVNEEAFNNLNFFRMNDLIEAALTSILDGAASNLDSIKTNYSDIVYVISGISIALLIILTAMSVWIQKVT